MVKKSGWVARAGCLLAVFIIAMWSIDMAACAILNDLPITNGFLSPDPLQLYHFWIWVAIADVFILFLIVVHLSFLKEEGVPQEVKG